MCGLSRQSPFPKVISFAFRGADRSAPFLKSFLTYAVAENCLVRRGAGGAWLPAPFTGLKTGRCHRLPGVNAGPKPLSRNYSRQNLAHHAAMHVGQAEIAARVMERQALMVETQQVQE